MGQLKSKCIEPLLSIYLITTFGTVLSGIASFLNLGTSFSSIHALTLALSFKTLAACLFSWKADGLIKRVGVVRSLILSQVLGCLVLGIIFVGFETHNYLIILIGIMLTSMPTVLAGIVITIILKMYSERDEHYVRYSSKRELFVGTASLLGAFTAPLLLKLTSFNCILGVDFATYLIGVLLSKKITILQLEKNTVAENKGFQIIKSKKTVVFSLNVMASLLLVCFSALIASSNDLSFTKNITTLFRQSMWSIDFLMAIVAGIIYLNWPSIRKKYQIQFFLVVNSPVLLLLIFFKNVVTVGIVLAVISFSTYLSFMLLRDDYVLAAGNEHNKIIAHTSYAMVLRSFAFFISPFYFCAIINDLSLNYILILTFLIQATFFCVSRMLNKK